MSIIGKLYQGITGKNLEETLESKKAKLSEKIQERKTAFKNKIDSKLKTDNAKKAEDAEVVLELDESKEIETQQKENQENQVTVIGTVGIDKNTDLTSTLLEIMGDKGYLDSGASVPKLSIMKSYAYNKIILPALYNKTNQEGTPYRFNSYEFNEVGEALAGTDRKITKEELMKLDMNGDGKITQTDIENFKADLIERKANDACTFLDENGLLPVLQGYNDDTYMEHDNLLLSNFYEEIPKDVLKANRLQEDYVGPAQYLVPGVGTTMEYKHNFKLNDFGKSIADYPGVITKEGLLKLDMDGDGKVSQTDIDAYKAKLEEDEYSTKDLTESLLTSLDEDGFLATGGGHVVCPPGFEEFRNKYGELKQFFAPIEGECGYQSYELNIYGLALAGKDGKITKEELMKLDLNGDGKITQKEIDQFKADYDEARATDLYTHLDNNDNLPQTLRYAKNIELSPLLANLYEKKVDEPPIRLAYEVEKVTYELNDFGKEIAGEDGVISKEELSKLDMDADGKITQSDIDAYKAKRNQIIKQPIVVNPIQTQLQQIISMLMNLFMMLLGNKTFSASSQDSAASNSDLDLNINGMLEALNSISMEIEE